MSLTGCGDLDIGDLDLYRFWRQLSQMLTNFDKIKTNKNKYRQIKTYIRQIKTNKDRF